jgi:hypothetical protein
MESEKYHYTIGDKKFIQRPLVLGQVNQLIAVMRGMRIPVTADYAPLMLAFGNKMPMAMAIVLLEQNAVAGKSRQDISRYLMDRELQPLADEIEFNAEGEEIARVIEDFFDCNPIASLLERFAAIGESLKSRVDRMKLGSIKSPSSSAAETSPGATP